MDQPKIERLLRLMKMMSGSVNYSIDELSEKLGMSYRTIYRYIDTFKSAGFVVERMYGNVYRLVKMPRSSTDISRLIYFSEEEAYLVNRLIDGISETNSLKANLKKKLSAVYDCTGIADVVGKKTNAASIEELADAMREKKRVWLRNYESAHGGSSRDRLVEPFDFTANYIDVWAFDCEDRQNKMFKISRMETVDVTDDDWTDEESHRKGMMDCFRMQSQKQTHIELRLSLRARNLLVEEYPLAERDIRRKGNGWVLSTEVSAMEGVGRFVAGLAGEVEIMKSDELKEYLRNYFSRCLKAIK